MKWVELVKVVESIVVLGLVKLRTMLLERRFGLTDLDMLAAVVV